MTTEEELAEIITLLREISPKLDAIHKELSQINMTQ
jgi:hypothetical protein